MRDQDLLKVFDYAGDPILTAQEVTDGLHTHFEIDVTTQAVRKRLGEMNTDIIATSNGWYAKAAPRLDDEVSETVADRRETDDKEFVPLDSN